VNGVWHSPTVASMLGCTSIPCKVRRTAMIFDELKPAYDRDGFVVVRGFLPPREFAELSGQLDRYIRAVVPTLPETAAFYHDRSRPETLKQLQHMTGDPYFADYAMNARWLALARALVGEDMTGTEPEWFDKPPGFESPTPPHQDNYYFNLAPPNVATIWLALDSVDDANGCLRYVAGSHRRGVRPHGRSAILGFSQGITDYGAEDRAGEVAIHLQPGDAVAHHGNTIHRADPNRTVDRHRRAFAMVFRGASCRRDEDSFTRYQAALKAQHAELGLKV
jgi:phytanoyl-CoA hydroxylase